MLTKASGTLSRRVKAQCLLESLEAGQESEQDWSLHSKAAEEREREKREEREEGMKEGRERKKEKEEGKRKKKKKDTGTSSDGANVL